MTARIAMYLPTLEGGGAERAFVDLANDFVARGHRVDMVLGSCHGPYVDELSADVRKVDFATTRWLDMLWRLVRYLARERPDVLLAGLDPANVVAVIASTFTGMRSRCVISQRAVIRPVWQLEHPKSWRFWHWLFRRTYRRARLVICNSTASAAEVTQDLGVDPGRCTVVLNAVDSTKVTAMARERIEDPWVSAGAAPLLVAVGRLMAVKDMETVVRAAAIVRRTRDCNLVILGEGVERPHLESLVRALGLEGHARLPGFAVNPFPWISAADVFVSGSLAEGCPNVIQQALACGTPVVATDCPGGTSEVLEHGKWGRLVPVRDPRAMADAILATLNDPTPPDGRVRARDFDRARTADRYLQLLLPAVPVPGPQAEYNLEAHHA